ncbi:hypothetical protein HMP09_2105 [Sphingomonas sp. HMP9]|uniref:hypothetical protein n=1 Tax=Sphingomonas sp. HMP9 TaxID=1517554 RepID=UPI001596E9D1|nr:hypothetical protein [Sphingomonas sp. HMP9]BCA62871.1 hypothetical protein HMP09_2105 [Sphingomonas sp. HMP9]
MRNIDFSSWQNLLATVFGLALVTLIGVGIRLLTMVTIQQRRERTNRQINERLRTLIAAYKTLGGSFTGTLTVDPAHRRDLRQRSEATAEEDAEALDLGAASSGSDRARRIRDAVEGALSDIILLGTDEQVQLAARAAHELVAGRPVPTHELVVSMRNFIREALDLDPIPRDLVLPAQGPTRPSGLVGRGKNDQGKAESARGGGGGGGAMGGGPIINSVGEPERNDPAESTR